MAKKKGERKLTPEYFRWRAKVLERDRWTCRHCGRPHIYLRAHHIFNWSSYKKLRYKVSNGITLCDPCHTEFHKIYGYTGNNNRQLYHWGIIGWDTENAYDLPFLLSESTETEESKPNEISTLIMHVQEKRANVDVHMQKLRSLLTCRNLLQSTYHTALVSNVQKPLLPHGYESLLILRLTAILPGSTI